MISEQTRARWRKAIDYLIEYGGPHMTEWEAGFVDSVSIRLGEGKDMTFKQAGILYRIWHRVEEKVG